MSPVIKLADGCFLDMSRFVISVYRAAGALKEQSELQVFICGDYRDEWVYFEGPVAVEASKALEEYFCLAPAGVVSEKFPDVSVDATVVPSPFE